MAPRTAVDSAIISVVGFLRSALNDGKCLPNLIRLFFFTCLLIGSLAHPLVSAAQVSDFGAETIDDDPLLDILLPLNEVQESDSDESSSDTGVDSLEEIIERNQDLFDDAASGDQTAPKELNLNAKDIEITALIKTVSKVTGRNYIVDADVKGKITIHLPSPVSYKEALKIFDSVLLLKGFTTVPVGENVWKVVSSSDAKTTTIPIVYESPDSPSDVLVTQLVRLKHVPAQDMQGVLAQFVSSSGGVNTFEGTNSLILIDSAANIARLLELVDRLDVPASDQDITIIPIQHAEVTDISEKINEILGTDDNQASQTTAARRTTNRTQARTNTRGRTTSTRGRQNVAGQTNTASVRRRLPLKVIADERTNSLIVVADPELTTKVRSLVEKLDSPIDKSSGRFYVYNLQHADAESISEILNNLISGATSSTQQTSTRTTGSSLSRSNNTQASTVNNNRNTVANRNNSRARLGNVPGGRVNFEGEVSIAPDPSTNSIIINASKSDYFRLKDVIDELDIKRRQVLVEATILEVRLSEEEGFGIELQGALGTDNAGFLAQSNFGGLTNLFTNPAALPTGRNNYSHPGCSG